ncbi:MAG: HEPN domain-containing protein [Thermodesulfovibrionia bacterium]|nr:HEPN domain-containing protein [Thermodesulfovibrionia bacterium]
MEKDVKYWVDLSKYDIKTSDAMFKSRRYLYVLFTCQQAVEKILKALVTKYTRQFPPKTHDLLKLIELSKIDIDEIQKEFLSKLSFYYIETRYPQEIAKILKDINGKMALEYLKNTKALIKWLKLKLK